MSSTLIQICAIALAIPAGSQWHDAMNKSLPAYMRIFGLGGSIICTAVAGALIFFGATS